MKSIKRVDCPVCRKVFHLINGHEIGALIQCPDCKDLFEIILLKPLMLESVNKIKYWEPESIDSITWKNGGG